MDFLFGFRGRIGRLQWWGAQFAILVFLAACMAALFALSPPSASVRSGEDYLAQAPWAAFTVIILMSVVTAWVGIGTTVKRFHDRDKSGWWYLIVLVPLIGPVWQIVECGFLPGSPGGNSYGHRGGGGNLADALDDDLAPQRITRAASTRMEQQTGRKTAATVPPVARPIRPAGFGRRGVS